MSIRDTLVRMMAEYFNQYREDGPPTYPEEFEVHAEAIEPLVTGLITRAESAESQVAVLREALVLARGQLEEYENDVSGERYNSLQINDALATPCIPAQNILNVVKAAREIDKYPLDHGVRNELRSALTTLSGKAG